MGILQSDGGVRGKQGQQFAITRAVEHAHDLIAHHERNGQFRARGLRGADVTRVFADVGGVHRFLLQDRRSGDPVVFSETNLVFAGIPADLRTDAQLPGFLVEQQDGDVRQMKIVPRDRQNSLQHLVQIKGGEHGLAGVV